jgi:hypothetical protein
MSSAIPAHIPLRKECPPGACVCDRARIENEPGADWRILQLTAAEEKNLISKINTIADHGQLMKLIARLRSNLGVELTIGFGARVRTVRGFAIALTDQPGLCRKTRESVPAAVRKCLERHPEIAHAILDADGLLGMGEAQALPYVRGPALFDEAENEEGMEADSPGGPADAGGNETAPAGATLWDAEPELPLV